MISVKEDPRGVCRGKRGVRKREDVAETRCRGEKGEEKNN